MSKVITVGELKAQLDGIPDDLPVYAWSLLNADPYPIIFVDTSISDRVDLNVNDSWKDGDDE